MPPARRLLLAFCLSPTLLAVHGVLATAHAAPLATVDLDALAVEAGGDEGLAPGAVADALGLQSGEAPDALPAVALREGVWGVAYRICDDKRGCRAYAALLAGDTLEPAVKRKVLLTVPAAVKLHKPEGITLVAAFAWDIEGDGKPELAIRIRVQETPGCGRDSHFRDYLYVQNVPLLTPAFFHELSITGEAADDDGCEWTLRRGDKDGDGRMELSAEQSCALRGCHDAETAGKAEGLDCVKRSAKESFQYGGKKKRYLLDGPPAKNIVRMARKDVPCPAPAKPDAL